MALQIERIPTLGDNYTYLVICEATREAAIIDAPEAEPVIARVETSGAKVTSILSTHHHPDHAMANPDLAERYGVPVIGHISDSQRLAGFTNGGARFLEWEDLDMAPPEDADVPDPFLGDEAEHDEWLMKMFGQ